MMYSSLVDIDAVLLRFAFVFLRIAAFVVAVPALSQWLNLRIRMAWTLVISIVLVMPQTNQRLTLDDPIPLLALQEIILGATFGIAISLLLYSAVIAGAWISQLSGGSLSFQSASSGKSPFSTLFMLMSTALFFSIGGHRQVIDALLTSFEQIQVGTAWDLNHGFAFMLNMISVTFELAFRAVFPILVSILLAAILTAIFSRFVPYFGFFSLGITINAVVTLAAVLFFATAMHWNFESEFAKSLKAVRQISEAKTSTTMGEVLADDIYLADDTDLRRKRSQ